MKKLIILIPLIILVIVSGCATVYLSPDGQSLSDSHGIIAILPPDVILTSTKGMSADGIKQQQEDESRVFQQEIYSYMLMRKSKGQMVIDIQDVGETNAILNKNKVKISDMSSGDLCVLLEVDAVLASQFSLSKPFSEILAVILYFLTNLLPATNEVNVSMSLKDCSQKSLIWKYDHKYSGNIISSPNSLIKGLMSDASRKMPYFK